MGRASYFLMGLRGPCLGEGKDAVPCEDPFSLSPLLRSLGTKRGQGRRASVHKRRASAVHVHGAPWLTRQKEARLHREESESGEALAESHSLPGALGAPCRALERKAKAERAQAGTQPTWELLGAAPSWARSVSHLGGRAELTKGP